MEDNMPRGDFPHGFVLSEAAQYAFLCQEVYGDILSFASAIPDHLKPLFLIPVKLETIVASDSVDRVASCRTADGAIPSGDTEEASWFGTKTFVNDDVQPTIQQTSPGSIFDVDGADEMTHHQEDNFDFNLQAPTDTSYMSDVDMTQYGDYPYRTKERTPRHSFGPRFASSVIASMVLSSRLARSRLQISKGHVPPVVFSRIAIKPEALAPRTPDKIKKNARSCTVGLTSYDKKNRVFTFSVTGGKAPRTVQAFLSDIDQVALSCDCPFWRWNGPEYHAKSEDYMLGQPFGTAGPPDVRDPDREYFLCKHAYAVLKRLDGFVNDIVDENWDLDEKELLDEVDENWDELSTAAEVPLEDLESDDVTLEVDWSSPVGDDDGDEGDDLGDSDESGNEEPEDADDPAGDDPSEEESEAEPEEEPEPEPEPEQGILEEEPEADYDTDSDEESQSGDEEEPEDQTDDQAPSRKDYDDEEEEDEDKDR